MAMQSKVSGMTCDHCVATVSKAVKAVPNVSNVTVDLDAGLVTVDGDADVEAVRNTIAEEGYKVHEAVSVDHRGDSARAPFQRVGC